MNTFSKTLTALTVAAIFALGGSAYAGEKKHHKKEKAEKAEKTEQKADAKAEKAAEKPAEKAPAGK